LPQTLAGYIHLPSYNRKKNKQKSYGRVRWR